MPRRPASTAQGSSPSIQSPTFAFVYPTGPAKRASSKNWPAWSAPEAFSSSTRAIAATASPKTPSTTAAERPRSGHSAHKARIRAYSSVRLPASHASSGWSAHSMESRQNTP